MSRARKTRGAQAVGPPIHLARVWMDRTDEHDLSAIAQAFGGTTLEATPWGSILEYLQYRSGLSLPSWLFDPAWRVAAATFALNASGTVQAVIRDQGFVWTTIEYPILEWRGIPVEYFP